MSCEADRPMGRFHSSGGSREAPIITDRTPLPLISSLRALMRCVATTVVLLLRRRISQPKERLGNVLRFGDGTRGRVYRETVLDTAPRDAPAVLVVAFKLRWVHGRGHPLFRAESLLNTPLFVGFPGFVSKLWLAHDGNETYRGFYEWDDAQLADVYVRALWWVLALVSIRESIRYAVLPDLRRDDVLDDPAILHEVAPGQDQAWWRLAAVEQPHCER